MKAAQFGPRTGKLSLVGRTPAKGDYSFEPPGDHTEGNDGVLVLSQG